MIFLRKDASKQFGFFVPALVLVFLVVLFIAMLFGAKLLQKSEPTNIHYSARYHELSKKEFISEQERTELEVERCRFNRDMLNHLEHENSPNYDQAKSHYDATCSDKLPRLPGAAAGQTEARFTASGVPLSADDMQSALRDD